MTKAGRGLTRRGSRRRRRHGGTSDTPDARFDASAPRGIPGCAAKTTVLDTGALVIRREDKCAVRRRKGQANKRWPRVKPENSLDDSSVSEMRVACDSGDVGGVPAWVAMKQRPSEVVL